MPRPGSPSLTDAEARIMAVLWHRQRATVADVVGALSPRRRTTYSTVQTILRILEEKGYVAHDKAGRAFVYRPLVDQAQARRRALRHLVARMFDNSPTLLVLNVLEHEPLDAAELARVRKLIEHA
jgi:BlaI family transcriptional regulator, penicillinase repressor